MIKIEYPPYPFRIKNDDNKEFIFDELRKLWVRLTPEEWVRQNILQYLLQSLFIPSAVIAVEKEIKLAERVKRFDILVYNSNTKPVMMIECKAMDIPLSTKTIDQILVYNQAVPVPYLIISNGIHCVGYFNQHTIHPITALPLWNELDNLVF